MEVKHIGFRHQLNEVRISYHNMAELVKDPKKLKEAIEKLNEGKMEIHRLTPPKLIINTAINNSSSRAIREPLGQLYNFDQVF